MSHHIRIPTAVITFDYLWEHDEVVPEPEPDEVGKSWTLLDKPVPVTSVVARAYDDDGELYYRLMVLLPVEDPDQEYALERLLSILGRHAGVTSIRFPGRKELDVG